MRPYALAALLCGLACLYPQAAHAHGLSPNGPETLVLFSYGGGGGLLAGNLLSAAIFRAGWKFHLVSFIISLAFSALAVVMLFFVIFDDYGLFIGNGVTCLISILVSWARAPVKKKTGS